MNKLVSKIPNNLWEKISLIVTAQPFMSALPYPVIEKDGLRFSFESVGPIRTVRKIIIYDKITAVDGLFNLALLDEYDDGSLDDLSVTDNQDMPRVLATVIATMRLFFSQYPAATVIFSGSTPARTRLYRVVISQNLTLFSETFLVNGVLRGKQEPYQPNRRYDAFTVRLQTSQPNENRPEAPQIPPAG